jgi:hypothetical protein
MHLDIHYIPMNNNIYKLRKNKNVLQFVTKDNNVFGSSGEDSVLFLSLSILAASLHWNKPPFKQRTIIFFGLQEKTRFTFESRVFGG